MTDDSQHEREIRAARNQVLFRAVNEKARALNEVFSAPTDRFRVACECADVSCIETLEIAPHEYLAIRAEPRRFAVRPGHVYPQIESVVGEGSGYVVVEKEGKPGEVAEALEPLARGE